LIIPDVWAFRGNYDAATVKKIEKQPKDRLISTGYIILLLKENKVQSVHASLYPTRVMASVYKTTAKGEEHFDEIAISTPTPLHQGVKSTVNQLLEDGKVVVSLDYVAKLILTRQSLMGHIEQKSQQETEAVPRHYTDLIGTNRTLPNGEQYKLIDVKQQYSGDYLGVISFEGCDQKHCREMHLILDDLVPCKA
jgi:hypothetical protein